MSDLARYMSGGALGNIRGRLVFERDDHICIALEDDRSGEATYYEFDDRTACRHVERDRHGNMVPEVSMRQAALFVAMNMGKLEQQALETQAKEPPPMLKGATRDVSEKAST